MKQEKIFLQSVLFLFCLIALLSGCDNGDDNNSTGGTSVLSSSEVSDSVGGSGVTQTSASTADLKSYLTTAINDEYRAKNTYIAVMNKFGQVKPFVEIKESEEQHISMLVNLFNQYGLSVPANTGNALSAPATLSEACSLGVQAEIENVQMYDDLLAGTTEYADVQTVFKQLQSASQNQHLPAFQNCAD
ncbi:MAG: DUF2202 domain-containing protein [Candidatus Electrothrix sp. AS4_5]|nr:DUF2202 domain-containing protein [Candidatus Electrothrix gigas]